MIVFVQQARHVGGSPSPINRSIGYGNTHVQSGVIPNQNSSTVIIQVQRLAALDEDEVLSPQMGVIVYPHDVQFLINGRDLTGEVYELSF